MTASSAKRSEDKNTLLVPSRLFGPLRVADDQVIVFPEGLLGFTGAHRFVLLPAASEGVFWLHSVEEGNLAFLVLEPTRFFPDYSVEVDETIVPFDVSDPSALVVLTIVTLPRQAGSRPTANLRAPLVLNFTHRCGCQLLLKESDYQPRHTFDLADPEENAS